MGTEAQQKLEALTFWGKHSLNATRDAFKVNRSTPYRWRKTCNTIGLGALHDAATPRTPAGGANGRRHCALRYAGCVSRYPTWAARKCGCCWRCGANNVASAAPVCARPDG